MIVEPTVVEGREHSLETCLRHSLCPGQSCLKISESVSGLSCFTVIIFYFATLGLHGGPWASLVAACGLISCSMWDLTSLSRDQTPGPLHWEHRVLTPEPPRSLSISFFPLNRLLCQSSLLNFD